MSAEAVVRRRALQDFYGKYTGQVPADEKLDGILAKYTNDDDLFAALCGKYKLSEPEVTERRRKMRRLEEFYAQYAPDSAHKVATIMQKSDDFEGLLDALRAKYKVSVEDFPNIAASPKKKSKKAAAAAAEEAPAVAEAAPIQAAAAPAAPPAAEVALVAPPAAAGASTAAVPTAAPSSAAVVNALEAFQNRHIAINSQQKVREQMLLVRETALKTLASAVDAKMDSLAILPKERSAPWSSPADVSLEVNNQFLTHLASIEQRLLKRACELSAVEASISEREASLGRAEEYVAAQREQLERELDVFVATRAEATRQHAALAATLDERRAHCDRQMPLLERREEGLAAREGELEARLRDVSDREARLAAGEASLQVQLSTAAEERELAKRLSEEVLKREATVRVVERGLNQARVELTKLEDDLAARTKTLLSDENALRGWAADVDRKEAKLLAVLEQLKLKGVVVSGI